MTEFDEVLPAAADPPLCDFDAEEEGMVAAMCGCKLRHNPYPEESDLWQEWNEGYFSECAQRGESDEEWEFRETWHKTHLAELKREGTWEYLRPPTPEERAAWAKDPDPPIETGLRRWRAKHQQKQR